MKILKILNSFEIRRLSAILIESLESTIRVKLSTFRIEKAFRKETCFWNFLKTESYSENEKVLENRGFIH